MKGSVIMGINIKKNFFGLDINVYLMTKEMQVAKTLKDWEEQEFINEVEILHEAVKVDFFKNIGHVAIEQNISKFSEAAAATLVSLADDIQQKYENLIPDKGFIGVFITNWLDDENHVSDSYEATEWLLLGSHHEGEETLAESWTKLIESLRSNEDTYKF